MSGTTGLNVANAITLVRIVLIPPIAMGIARQNYLTALVLMAVAGVTDFADGKVARRTGSASHLGAVLDITADVTLVLVVQVCLLASGWPAYLLALSVASILVFVFVPAQSRRPSSGSVGKYVGAVLMCAITGHLVCLAVSPGRWHSVAQVLCPAVAAYLGTAIVQNLSRAPRYSIRRSHD